MQNYYTTTEDEKMDEVQKKPLSSIFFGESSLPRLCNYPPIIGLNLRTMIVYQSRGQECGSRQYLENISARYYIVHYKTTRFIRLSIEFHSGVKQ